MGERIFDGLNDAQREAVDAVTGPVAILAGAGTGKTTTITRRIANQVLTGTFMPGEILAVTFTAKAAGEMRARLQSLGATGVRANTFHAEALAQFRRFAPSQPEILSHKGQVLHRIAQSLPMPHRFTALRDLAGEIEWAKNRRIGARDYLEQIGTHEPPIPADLMHRVFVTYEKRKRNAGLIDFEDLLEQTVAILQEDERALAVVRGRYRAFTVDEYQDVNLLQQTLLDLWVGARDDVCVVGDDYQSIFGFTGATPEYLLRFARRWDHTTVVTLEDNYRSTPGILAVANRLVPRMGGSRKTLRATKEDGPSPVLRDFEAGREEVAWIVAECARLNGSGVPYEEMAVLFRINGRSEDYEEAFARAGIAFQVRDGAFLARPAARSFFARARAASGPVATEAARIASDLGYDPAGTYDGGDEATRQADLERLVALASEFGGDDVHAFLADLRARFAPDSEGRGVQLMTYHRAKGLEFEAVFLPRLEDKELPFALSTSAEDVAEERRLFYVGITRAKRFLAVSCARTRDGERRSKPRPSPFLSEIRPPSDRPVAVAAPARASAPAGSRAPAAPAGSPLFEALRSWRAGVARDAGLPAYVVFHDATLAEIARLAPATRAALRSISGVGPLKMQRYGDEILKIVATFPVPGVPVTAAG
ncbi:MAG: ATP-dependent helicase [Actinomycetota bacterium]